MLQVNTEQLDGQLVSPFAHNTDANGAAGKPAAAAAADSSVAGWRAQAPEQSLLVLR
jgi:hypothetical protein